MVTPPRAGRRARGARARHHAGAAPARKDRPDAGRARSRPHQAGVPVRLGAGAHRRLRRQGRPAQPVQHLPRRSRQVRGRPGALSRADASPTCGPPATRWLDTPNRLLVRFRPEAVGPAAGVHARSLEAAAVRHRPAVRRARRCRPRSWRTGSSSSSSSATTCRRWRSPSPRGPAPSPIRPARRAPRDDDADARPGHEDALGAGDRETRSATSASTLDGGAGARSRASGSRCSSATSGRRSRSSPTSCSIPTLPGVRGRAREEAAARHAGPAGEEPQRGRGAAARHPRLRRRPSVRPAGAGLPPHDRAHHPRRPRRLPRGALEAGQLGAHRSSAI